MVEPTVEVGSEGDRAQDGLMTDEVDDRRHLQELDAPHVILILDAGAQPHAGSALEVSREHLLDEVRALGRCPGLC
jgi:hypothetical protein